MAFLAQKICAISVLNANFCVAKCCIDSSERCADVRSFTPHALGKCNRVFRAPRAKTAKILREFRVLTTQILRERAAKRAEISPQNAPPTQPRAVPTSQNFCNDAGWIGGVLRITDAENFATSSRTSARKICTISVESALHANFLRCQTLH